MSKWLQYLQIDIIISRVDICIMMSSVRYRNQAKENIRVRVGHLDNAVEDEQEQEFDIEEIIYSS